MDNKSWIIMCIFVGFVCFMVGINWYELFPPNYKSNEEIYDEMIPEFEYYMQRGGMWDKKVSDIPVHVSNHKERVYFEIEKFRRIACNGTT